MKTSARVKKWTGLCLGACLLTSLAANAAPGTPWNELTTEQRQLLLKAQEERWNTMPAERQQRMLEGIERWQKMSPQERERIRSEREKFRAMPPDERTQLRERHQQRHKAIENLPPEQQQRLRECKRRKQAGEAVDCAAFLPP